MMEELKNVINTVVEDADPNNLSILEDEMEIWLKCWLNLKEENEKKLE